MKYSWIILSLLISIISCTKPDDTTNLSPNKRKINAGNLKLIPQNLERLPYLGKKEIVFTDSLSNKIKFSINELTQSNGEFIEYYYDVYAMGDTVCFTCLKQFKSFYIKNDSINLEFRISLTPRITQNSFTTIYKNINGNELFVKEQTDQLSIYINSNIEKNLSHSVFILNIPISNLESTTYNKYFSEINFFNQTFFKVLLTEYSNPKSLVYFNFEKGIVSFTDHNGKSWVFDSIK